MRDPRYSTGMKMLAVATEHGDVEIFENELASVTKEELAILRLSRKQLHRLFAEGVKLMQGSKLGEWVRPIAAETLDGNWEVHICHYSPLSDPLMQGRRPKGKLN
jgi:hypothetical protein